MRRNRHRRRGQDAAVACVFQNPDASLTFVTDGCLTAFTPDSLIVDVSCDEELGFKNTHYYAVDHSPTLLWDSAT